MSGKSDFLFAQPTFWEGMGRLLDFGNFLTQYNTSPSSATADEIALAMDWRAVYKDLYAAYEQFVHSTHEAVDKEKLAASLGR